MPGLGKPGAVIGLLVFGTLTSLLAKIGALTSALTSCKHLRRLKLLQTAVVPLVQRLQMLSIPRRS